MVQVVEVEAPAARGPGARRRSRWQSVLLVVTSLFMVGSMGLVATAPPANAWFVPVAKVVGGTAVSMLGPAAVEWVLGDGSKDEGGDDEESKKKRGKWGDKLKGVPGLAAGILGGLWGTTEAVELLRGDGDGVAMPEDLKEDVADPDVDTFPNVYGGESEYTITGVEWIAYSTGATGIRTTADMTCSAEDPAECRPLSAQIAQAAINLRCYDTDSQEFYADSRSGIYMNGIQSLSSQCRRYNSAGDRVYDPIQSAYIRMLTGSVGPYPNKVGLSNPQRWINDKFDPAGGTVPETETSITAEVQCSEVGTGATQTLSKTVRGTAVMPVAQCPTGWKPESIGWTQQAPGGDAPEYLGGIKPKTPEGYPDCPPGACSRVIYVDGQPCNALRPECFDWMRTEPPTRVRCDYGPYNMPIAECGDLEHVHKSTHGVTWGPNPETGTPEWLPAREDGTIDSTRVGTEWAPEDNPNREYRPPIKGPLIQIGGEPGTDPPGEPVPNPPTVQVPPPVVNPPTNIEDPETTRNCMGGMASWNPVDWVLTPVKCALSWAFIPKPAAAGQLTATATATITDAGLGDWLGVPTAVASTIPEGGGCRGPALNMPEQLGGATYHPLDACDDPMSRYAALSRAVTSVVVVVLGGFVAVNGLSLSLTGYRLVERESKGTVST